MKDKIAIGPRMLQACRYIDAHPGASVTEVARNVGPNGSNYYGWRIVRRVLKAGLAIDVGKKTRTELFLTVVGGYVLRPETEKRP